MMETFVDVPMANRLLLTRANDLRDHRNEEIPVESLSQQIERSGCMLLVMSMCENGWTFRCYFQ